MPLLDFTLGAWSGYTSHNLTPPPFRPSATPTPLDNFSQLTACIKPARSSPGLRSSFTLQLHIPHSTVCQQPAVARFLSQPPFSGTLCQTTCSLHRLSSFRRQLKTLLFHQSFPDII